MQKNIYNETLVELIRFTVGDTQYDFGYGKSLGDKEPRFTLSAGLYRIGEWKADEMYSAEELAHSVATTLVAKGKINPNDHALKTIKSLVYALWTSNAL